LEERKNCPKCSGRIVKNGIRNGHQRYKCKNCSSHIQSIYTYKAYLPDVNSSIIALNKECCGIRSIGRILGISPNTVMLRIKKLARKLPRPRLKTNQEYEIDELRTYLCNKNNPCWIMYAINRETREVAHLKVGRRNTFNLKSITDRLLLAKAKKIFSDGLGIYKTILPENVHKVKTSGISRIDRKNLGLRNNLKRLSRRTICYSKNLQMLEACEVELL